MNCPEMSCLWPLGIRLLRKRDAAFTASREYVTVGLHVLMELKCAVVCYWHDRVFNPTNLLNHVTLSIKLIVQI